MTRLCAARDEHMLGMLCVNPLSSENLFESWGLGGEEDLARVSRKALAMFDEDVLRSKYGFGGGIPICVITWSDPSLRSNSLHMALIFQGSRLKQMFVVSVLIKHDNILAFA